MKNKAFTLIEILLAMAVIGIIAGATANALKNISANKVKVTFKNNYTHMLRTIQTLSADEITIPALFDENNIDNAGKPRRHSFCEVGGYLDNNLLFPSAFMDATGGLLTSAYLTDNMGYSFTTKNGTFWVVKRRGTCADTEITLINDADYWIKFDTNGLENGPNCPYTGNELNDNVGNCGNPDTFSFGLSRSNNIIYDNAAIYNGKNLKTYLETNNFIESK